MLGVIDRSGKASAVSKHARWMLLWVALVRVVFLLALGARTLIGKSNVPAAPDDAAPAFAAKTPAPGARTVQPTTRFGEPPASAHLPAASLQSSNAAIGAPLLPAPAQPAP